MRQVRIVRRRSGTPAWREEPLAVSPYDPDVVRAERIARDRAAAERRPAGRRAA